MNTHQVYGKSYAGTPAENYQRVFVPAIAAPMSHGTAARASMGPVTTFRQTRQEEVSC